MFARKFNGTSDYASVVHYGGYAVGEGEAAQTATAAASDNSAEAGQRTADATDRFPQTLTEVLLRPA